tara:strand:+ start:100 stop:444 length:345 start_codon:yes stop_codon:yes gene_type:complete
MVEKSFIVSISGEVKNAFSVELKRSKSNLTVKCDCSSGDRVCSHIISTLFGEKNKIIGCDGRLTQKIDEMVAGSDVEHAFNKLRDLTIEAARVKSELSEARQGLGEAIRDFKAW